MAPELAIVSALPLPLTCLTCVTCQSTTRKLSPSSSPPFTSLPSGKVTMSSCSPTALSHQQILPHLTCAEPRLMRFLRHLFYLSEKFHFTFEVQHIPVSITHPLTQPPACTSPMVISMCRGNSICGTEPPSLHTSHALRTITLLQLPNTKLSDS